MHRQPNNGLSLIYLRLFLGIAALLTELYFNIQFLSQGVSGVAFGAAISFAVISDVVKILFAGDVTFYRAIGKPDSALFSFCIVAVLVSLSILASLWFLTANPLKNDVALTNANARIEQLQKSVEAKKTQIAACPSGYISKCVTPQTAQLTALEKELGAAMKQQAAFNDSAANQKFWQMMGETTGSKPENLQLGLSLLRSVILELLGVILCGQFFGNNRLRQYVIPLENQTITPPLNATDNDSNKAELEQLKAENAKLLEQLKAQDDAKKD